MEINYSDEKNDILKQTRGICFEDVMCIIESNEIIDIQPHSNLDKYPNQKIMIVSLNSYIHYVPYVEII